MSERHAPCDACKRDVLADLIVPCETWVLISPTRDLGGYLCPNCILERLDDQALHCEAALMGPTITSISEVEMSNLRRVENIELALEGFRNRWGAALDARIAEGGIEPRGPTPPSRTEDTNARVGADGRAHVERTLTVVEAGLALARFIKQHATEETLSTHVEVTFDAYGASGALNLAERVIALATDSPPSPDGSGGTNG